MERRATDRHVPVAMAPPHEGTCERCGARRDIIWPVHYASKNGKENVRELCTRCREDCGYGTRWRYAGGGDVVAMPA